MKVKNFIDLLFNKKMFSILLMLNWKSQCCAVVLWSASHHFQMEAKNRDRIFWRKTFSSFHVYPREKLNYKSRHFIAKNAWLADKFKKWNADSTRPL